MPQIDRQSAFSGTKEVAAPLRFDAARLEALSRRACARLRRAARRCASSRAASRTRPICWRRRSAQLRAAAQAARQAAALRACGRPRVPRDQRAARARLSGRARRCSIATTRASSAPPFYVMGFVAGRVFWEPHMPGSHPAERAAVYDAHERDHRAAACLRSGRDRARRFRPRRELRRAPGRALVEAVPRLGDRDRSTRWSG